MRIKGILLLIVCICLTTIFYCLLGGDPNPTFNTIHKQLNQLKGVVISGNRFQNRLDLRLNTANQDINSEESERKCDKYLRVLGLKRNRTEASVDGSAGTVSDKRLATVWPVFVTAVNSDQLDLAKGFVKSFQDYIYGNYSLIIYDLGLNEHQILSLSNVCNDSQTQQNTSKEQKSITEPDVTVESIATNSPNNKSETTIATNPLPGSWCTIRTFNYDIFPAHVSDLKLFAFRPIILQLVLDELGSALWLDPNYYLLPSAAQKATELASKGKKEGIIAWTIDQPTSSLTHPRMFEYFKTVQNQYYFHRMIKPSHILLYNTRRIHLDLMLPWVKCALTPECIAPIGAQAYGCRFDKKPLYRYSGCHHYDTSAINVVLGQMFNFNEKPYSASEDEKFFRLITIYDDIYTEDDIQDTEYVSNQNLKPPGARRRNTSFPTQTSNRNG